MYLPLRAFVACSGANFAFSFSFTLTYKLYLQIRWLRKKVSRSFYFLQAGVREVAQQLNRLHFDRVSIAVTFVLVVRYSVYLCLQRAIFIRYWKHIPHVNTKTP